MSDCDDCDDCDEEICRIFESEPPIVQQATIMSPPTVVRQKLPIGPDYDSVLDNLIHGVVGQWLMSSSPPKTSTTTQKPKKRFWSGVFD